MTYTGIEIETYRLENHDQSTLGSVDFEDASYDCGDKFRSNQEAFDTAVNILNNEGALAFTGKKPQFSHIFLPSQNLGTLKMLIL